MFELLKTDVSSRARLGRLTTAHGAMETPVLMSEQEQVSVLTSKSHFCKSQIWNGLQLAWFKTGWARTLVCPYPFPAALCVGCSLFTLPRRPHAPALSDPLQRQGRLSPQPRRDANLPRIAFAAALPAVECACGRKPFC
jgi:hypothetical protein